jgi:undecaprenyl-diphosphatase
VTWSLDVALNEQKFPTTRAAASLGLGVLAAVWLAMLLFGVGPIDRDILMFGYSGGHPVLTSAARAVSAAGCGDAQLLFISAGALWLLVHRRYLSAWFLPIAVIIGRQALGWQKIEVGRPRPHAVAALAHATSPSFPSGHAADSMMVYLLLALLLTHEKRDAYWASAAAVLLSVAVGASRVVLGVHWPSDVMGGWAFGLFWALTMFSIVRKFEGPWIHT